MSSELFGPKKIKYDELLNNIEGIEIKGIDDETGKIERKQAQYKNNSSRFLVKKKNFMKQYFQIYFNRLQRMRPFVQARAEQKWGDYKGEEHVHPVSKILQVKQDQLCYVTGTLYKEMPLKPNVLREYSKERSITTVKPKESYVSGGDTLILEDETGRMKLVGEKIDINSLVTGIIIAVLGREIAGGDFEVIDWCFGDLAPQPEIQVKGISTEPVFLAFISGMNVGNEKLNPLPLEMFLEWIEGHIGSEEEQQMVSRIARLVIVGNSIHQIETEESSFIKFQNKRQISEEQERVSRPIHEFDVMLTSLCQNIHVDIIPGPSDPSSYSLPQQALNPCLFPLSAQYTTFHSVPNPHEFQFNGKIFLGSSGQNIDNLSRYINRSSTLDVMEDTLKWRHIAPTAPDTLACFPFLEDDPFIIDECPHLYFIGNQPQFETKTVVGAEGQSVKLVLVPDFSITQTILLVNSHTLEIHPIRFDVDLSVTDSNDSSSQ